MTPNQINFLLHSIHLIRAISRCGSFSAAALSLGMSQPAVSQQVAQLEKLLGKVLFERRRRGVTLTVAGQILHDATDDIMETLSITTERLYDSNLRERLTILTDYGFSACWLLPRLPEFEASHPDIDVSLLTAQTKQDTRAGHHSHAPDITILFGDKPHLPETSPICLFKEEIVPVCSPAYRQAHGPFVEMEDFLQGGLLHLEGSGTQWFSWSDWFRSAYGTAPLKSRMKKSFHFDNYPLILQAALHGQGLALGWRPLVNDLLEKGELVPLHEHVIRSERGYFLAPSPRKTPSIERFLAWMETIKGRPQV